MVTDFKISYIIFLRQKAELNKARKELENFMGMLEILFYNHEIPDYAKESLIEMQLERLELLKKDNRSEALKDISLKLERELKEYSGTRLEEFKLRLKLTKK